MKEERSTRAALIAAAIAIFRQKGFQSARVSDIVAAAGVAQGTFYNYFRSKEAIFREICNDFIGQVRMIFAERTDLMFSGETAEEIRGNVHRVIRDVFSVYQQNLDAAELLLREGIGHGGLFKEIYEDILNQVLDLIRGQVNRGIARGVVHVSEPEMVSVFIFGLFERTLFYFLLVRKNMDLQRLEEALADFILRGLSFEAPHR
ncbi:MAG TPA: TetR/AcrR family transcriptional regulator [Desulfosalsimonadaceae bacterium]|nr:TetR/AcrR family transcriptional regulator [Desulfosalsimonadaceae bacterium]